jgi:hypothetical protein
MIDNKKNIFKTVQEILYIDGIKCLTQETFNEGLSKKLPAIVIRNTSIIEYDDITGKLSIKKYFINKVAEKVIFKSGFISYKLKIRGRSYSSLTLNKNNTDFSIYTLNGNRKPFVRKNQVNERIIYEIKDMVNNDTIGWEMFNILISKLNIGNNTINENLITPSDALKNLVLERFLSGYGLIYDKSDLDQIAIDFRYNKKHYLNKNMSAYYSDMLCIDDPKIFNFVKSYFNGNINGSFNYLILSLYSNLGYSWEDFNIDNGVGTILDDLLEKDTFQNHDVSNLTEVKNDASMVKKTILRYGREVFVHLIENSRYSGRAVISLIKTLTHIQDLYSVSFENNPYFLKKKYTINFIDIISDVLYETTQKTGIYLPTEEFVKICNKTLPSGYKASVSSRTSTATAISEINDNMSRVKMSLTNNNLPTPNSIYLVKYPNYNKPDLTWSLTFYLEDNLKKSLDNLLIKTNRKNSLLDFKGVFSIKEFEKELLCQVGQKTFNSFKKSVVYTNN